VFAARRWRSGPLSAGAASLTAAQAPTSHRRDVILTDPVGAAVRVAGASLTPGVSLGSDGSDGAQLDGAGVTAGHVRLWAAEGRLMMVKTCEAPVFLNGRLIGGARPERLSTGDRLRLGQTEFRVKID
jgi:hypothetical protein